MLSIIGYVEVLKKIKHVIKTRGFGPGLSPFIIGVTGHGNVSGGAQEILHELDCESIHPKDMQTFVTHKHLDRKRIYKLVFQREEKLRAKDGKGFYFEEYLKNPKQFMTRALHKAHFAVIKAGKEQDPPLTPGTTAVLCLVQNGSAWWSHVGDSRLYLFRGSVPIYRTKDHSFVEKLYQSGKITSDKRSSHPLRNYMTRCIGLSDNVPEVTVSSEVKLQQGDVIMCCSDGLWEPLDDMQMGMKIMEGRLGDALDKLAQQAEETSYPSSDNISAVAIQIMSLQLVGRAINDNFERQVSRATRADPVQTAIDVIEQTVKLYEDEMK